VSDYKEILTCLLSSLQDVGANMSIKLPSGYQRNGSTISREVGRRHDSWLLLVHQRWLCSCTSFSEIIQSKNFGWGLMILED